MLVNFFPANISTQILTQDVNYLHTQNEIKVVSLYTNDNTIKSTEFSGVEVDGFQLFLPISITNFPDGFEDSLLIKLSGNNTYTVNHRIDFKKISNTVFGCKVQGEKVSFLVVDTHLVHENVGYYQFTHNKSYLILKLHLELFKYPLTKVDLAFSANTFDVQTVFVREIAVTLKTLLLGKTEPIFFYEKIPIKC